MGNSYIKFIILEIKSQVGGFCIFLRFEPEEGYV